MANCLPGILLISPILEEMLKKFANAIPNLIGALLVFFLGYFLAKLIRKVARAVFSKIGVDKLGDKLNDIDIVHKANIRIVPSDLLAKVIYYFMLLVVILAATDILAMPALSNLMSQLINYVPVLLSAMVVLVFGLLLADFLKNVVLTACQSLGMPSAKLISNFVFYFMFLTVAVSALAQAGIDTRFISNNLTVILGGGALAFAFGYGFASRDLVANMLASFYSKSKVQIGDRIRIDGTEGVVSEMDSSSLILQSGDRRIIIPLSKLTSEKVEIFEDSIAG